MKCSNPSCARKAHQSRKKCFQCLVSNAKYMRYYREGRKLAQLPILEAYRIIGENPAFLRQLKFINRIQSSPVSAPPAEHEAKLGSGTA